MPNPVMRPIKPMNMPFRVFGAALLGLGLSISAPLAAQEPAPSTTPEAIAAPATGVTHQRPKAAAEPGASVAPVVVVDPTITETEIDVSAPDPVSDADAARIEAEVERAQAHLEQSLAEGRRSMERAVREMEEARASVRRESDRAAGTATLTDEVRARAELEARRATRDALRATAAVRADAVREAVREALQESRPGTTEHERAAREEARARAEQQSEKARDVAREARGRAQNIQDLYEEAMDSIDDEDWNESLRPLSRLMGLNAKVDAALYWTSYAQAKLDLTGAALESLARLQKEFPASRWAREGKALELEVRGRSGQVPRPDQQDDLDLKLMAVAALAQTAPQEAMPELVRILSSPSIARRVRERSLFVLAQIGSEPAANAIAEVARGDASPELQRKAIQYLGVFGGTKNRRVLSDIYASSNDTAVRKQILNAFMISGDKARVLSAAKTEENPSLRADAVRLLGVMGGTTELSQMYGTATSTDEKKAILHALFLGGAAGPIATAAKGEKDKAVRLSAVRNLGLMGRTSEDTLKEMYPTETDPEVKREVLKAFFLQNNADRLIEIAKTEKDPALRKEAVHWLSLMSSPEARSYMTGLLKE